jgi:hypothetical protein
VTALLRGLDRFWFAGAPAPRLAWLRILVGGFVLVDLATRYRILSRVGETSPSLFDPVGLAAVLAAPITPAAYRGLLLLTLAANVAFVLGWRHRYTGPLFAALLLASLSYRNSWSMIYHSENLLVLHVLILGLAPAADALSVDALLRSTAAVAREPSLVVRRARDPAGDWAYGYAIRLLCAVTVATYLVAAVAKLAGPLGWGWASGEALRGQIAVDALRKELLGDGATALAFALYDQLWLLTLVAIGSLALELAAPLALLSPRLGQLWAGGAFLMHWGILLIMGITFEYHLSGVAFASFFNLDRVVAAIGPRTIGWRSFGAPAGVTQAADTRHRRASG